MTFLNKFKTGLTTVTILALYTLNMSVAEPQVTGRIKNATEILEIRGIKDLEKIAELLIAHQSEHSANEIKKAILYGQKIGVKYGIYDLDTRSCVIPGYENKIATKVEFENGMPIVKIPYFDEKQLMPPHFTGETRQFGGIINVEEVFSGASRHSDDGEGNKTDGVIDDPPDVNPFDPNGYLQGGIQNPIPSNMFFYIQSGVPAFR